MANRILMQTDQVEKFRGILLEMSETIKERMNDLKYLIDNFNQVSSSMSILKEHMYKGVKVGNDIRNMIDKMAFDVEKARQAFIAADSNTSGIESVAFSPFGAGVVGSMDKVISVASEKGLLGKRTNTIETGINRVTRRAFDLPKTVDEVKPLVKLREGFGACGTVMAAGTAYEDWKNNSSIDDKVEAMVIDGATTAFEFAKADAIADFGATGAVGAVEFAAGVVGVAALPEVAVGAVAVVGAVAAVGVADYFGSKIDSGIKGFLGIK